MLFLSSDHLIEKPKTFNKVIKKLQNSYLTRIFLFLELNQQIHQINTVIFLQKVLLIDLKKLKNLQKNQTYKKQKK